ncbi:MAG: helicase UvrD [Dehalococcoidia bacterium]|nr:helicase UvrD [Dehalococcoidia bacterium]
MPRRPRTTPVPTPGPAPQPTTSIAIPLDEQAEEERRLRQTIEFIDGAVLRLRDRATTKSANLDLVVATTVNTHELLTQLEQARPSPYFGRVDFHPSVVTPQAGSREGSSGPRRYKRESHYIGKYHVPDHVSSWTAPVAALYYKPAATGYRAPEGYVSGRIELKREFEIRDSQIKAIADLVRLLPSGQTAAIAAIPASTSLEKALRGIADGEMYEAIQTIQPEQYEEIAAGEKLVMVLQGAAGSGKSLVGLHRIAYLLSPFSEISRIPRPRANRVVMFGPSKAFLDYVSGLLPSLGHRDIRQTTLRAWMLGSFSQPIQAEQTDRFLTELMTGKTQTLGGATGANMVMEAERFKGSREMADLLERYAKSLRRDFISNAKPISVRPAMGDVVVLDVPEVVRLAAEAPQLPLNEARSRVVEQAFQAILTKGKFREDIELRTRLRTTLLPSVRTAVDRFWPVVDVRRAYARLLIKEADLASYGVSREVARQLALSAPREDAPAGVNDLAPLLYLDHLLNPISSQGFEHVVVDEAQDVSPLEIMLLKKHSFNGSFTIMGDIRQRLFPHRGVRDWAEVTGLFDADDTANFDSNTSYRSTQQITDFANRILAKVPGGAGGWNDRCTGQITSRSGRHPRLPQAPKRR